MLGFLKKSQEPSVTQRLWKVPLHVGRGSSTEMPANLAGAYVFVYVGAPNHEAALKAAVMHVRSRGYEFLDLHGGQVLQLEPSKWQSYINSTWAEHRSHFPTQAEVISKLSQGFVFCGPFASYERAAQQGAQADEPASGGPAA